MWSLITGAGSGMGRSLALALASRGHDLILVGRTATKLEQVARLIQRDHPESRIEILTADLSDPENTRQLGRRISRQVDHLSNLIYCAGVGEPAADVASLNLDDFQEALAVNVTSPLVLTQTLLPIMQGQEPASRIIMIGAGMDTQVQPGTGTYGVSKMALRRLVQQLALEFSNLEQGPLISLFQPGLVDTPGIRSHIDKARALNLGHGQWLADRLDAGDCLTAEQAATALVHALQVIPEQDFQGSVLRATELLQLRDPG